VQGLKSRGAAKCLCEAQIPTSIKALIKVARAPQQVIAARVAAKSEAARGI
jgi:hypothetical protein